MTVIIITSYISRNFHWKSSRSKDMKIYFHSCFIVNIFVSFWHFLDKKKSNERLYEAFLGFMNRNQIDTTKVTFKKLTLCTINKVFFIHFDCVNCMTLSNYYYLLSLHDSKHFIWFFLSLSETLYYKAIFLGRNFVLCNAQLIHV